MARRLQAGIAPQLQRVSVKRSQIQLFTPIQLSARPVSHGLLATLRPLTAAAP